MASDPASRARIAVLASATGSTFAHLVHSSRAGEISGEVVLLITTRPGAPVAEQARSHGVEHLLLDAAGRDADVVDGEMRQVLIDHEIDFVVLAGYLRKIGHRTLAAFPGRIVNTHPAPLPAFGGPGMYGEAVHQAVLRAGLSYSAATVHLIDAGYDTGPVIAEQPVPVYPNDTPGTLRDRVQAAERQLLISALTRLISNPAPSSG
jgi:phosphoribosylglycinamide formyltransferase-1